MERICSSDAKDREKVPLLSVSEQACLCLCLCLLWGSSWWAIPQHGSSPSALYLTQSPLSHPQDTLGSNTSPVHEALLISATVVPSPWISPSQLWKPRPEGTAQTCPGVPQETTEVLLQVICSDITLTSKLNLGWGASSTRRCPPNM